MKYKKTKKNKDKFILFTGGTGFLGSFLSVKLLQEGYNIFFLVRPRDGKEEKIRIIERLEAVGLPSELFSQVHIILGDITKPLCDISTFWIEQNKNKIKAIWHTAGLVELRNPQKLFSTNVEGTKNILEFTEKLAVNLYYISTAYVVGGLDKKIISEDELKNPSHFYNPYEKSKYEAEKIVRLWISLGRITATIFRPSILIGHSRTGQSFSFNGFYAPIFFFYRMQKFLKNNKFFSYFPIVIPYLKEATLNLIPVDCAVKLILSIAKNSNSKNRAFNIIHPYPPITKFVFENSLRHLGYSKVKFIRVSKLGMWSIKNILIILSYFFGGLGGKLRNDLLYYFDYLTDAQKFSIKNTQTILGESIKVSQVDRELLYRCINYAVTKNFSNFIV